VLDRSGQVRRKNLIAGSICLAVLPCFALFAVAQQRPAAQQPAASQQPAPSQQPAAAQQVQATHYISMPPGFSIRYESPRPFASVVSSNPKIAEAVPSQTDRVLVITSKPDVEGQTNFLLVDRSGQEIGNVVVTIAYPEQPLVREANKVVVHNKKDNLAGFTNYICNPICIRVGDPMEGGDRVPLQNLSSSHGTLNTTGTYNSTNITNAPAGTSPP
jgi:glucose/arabinose dehydrogenase